MYLKKELRKDKGETSAAMVVLQLTTRHAKLKTEKKKSPPSLSFALFKQLSQGALLT